MVEYIDREMAIEICDWYEHTFVECEYAIRPIADDLKKLPVADVQPVRQGHWLRTGRTNVYGGFEVECSVCNDSVMITNIEYEHYCRNCGARMDGEQDGKTPNTQ